MSMTMAARALALGILLVVGSNTAAGNEDAVIYGTVTDNHAAPIAGATVHVRNLMMEIEVHATTGKDGKYRVTGLRQGSYNVGAAASGYSSLWRYRIPVLDGESVRQDFTLTKLRESTQTR